MATTTITMNQDEAVLASFVKLYTLDLSSTTGGNVTQPGEGAFIYQ